jgi:hypothetical protein
MQISDIESGGKAWSADGIGDKLTGTITLIERRQQTSFTDNTPLTWDDGSPRMLTYIELATDERDPEQDDDDGTRALYLKGGRNFEPAEGKGNSGEVALVEAAKKAGMKSVDEGTKLTIACSGIAKATTRGYQPAKLYVIKLEAGKSSVEVDDFDFDD